MDAESLPPVTIKELPVVTPEPGTPCRYNARHQAANVPAVQVLDMSPVGIIPCCAQCVAFYRRMQ